ncbi:MAG: aminotransferase class III-fold pyridoxal phosphate-dependent enzyme, partial [Rhodospirillaceae bacterium]|nr:aminotransferase class III-fold pyridoxal phosphate-dependent enzyme [Rhodospirillaceae bacterium]
IACAAALAVQRAIVSRGLLENVVTQGEALSNALNERFGNHHNIGDIRGRGLFRGLEIVADRATREPFSADLGIAGKLKKAAFARGLICYPDNGTMDGDRGDHILLAPPFIIDADGLGEIVDKLGAAFDEVMSGIAE